ncbi:MAG: MBL fold metallo-hydrolase [Rhodospirillales bacterium]|jgi:glyoxylase-like metal-dependent hydrolase (beta-lactamase superfamily II)|nr:MBL fold metallo-hydrolase [Rhodospirillales bacterium]MBT4038967.1 MBL fold metallo-hydrolase [Rhodospirillales bacterium]MBT4626639.1 MBL fold metallo-hydrolase [Rhodospirillales bacterium]MBT5351889.1 MBL fold metallo-hydrolase [Rhodospirillales bacterium]MBT5521589.1 MBL fold metallo-hydrolase [Rhodospirillales bacterium]
MPTQIGDKWFEHKRIDDDITLIWEPYVDPLLRCNIWLVRGSDRDALIDSGLGVISLKKAVDELFEKDVTAVATHYHLDHVGSLCDFDDRVIHSLEADLLSKNGMGGGLLMSDYSDAMIESLKASGYPLPDELITALPYKGYDPATYTTPTTTATRTVDEGDMVDIGNRRFEVLHLPGHSPGSIGLWEKDSGIFFSGDAIYDGPLLDGLEDSSIPDYVRTMKRLRELPVRVVHAGHDQSFGRERLIELVDTYLKLRA